MRHGCGPGNVARYLRDAGTNVFGLDLSPRMVEQARQRSPEIRFREGDMTALDVPDGTLAVLAVDFSVDFVAFGRKYDVDENDPSK